MVYSTTVNNSRERYFEYLSSAYSIEDSNLSKIFTFDTIPVSRRLNKKQKLILEALENESENFCMGLQNFLKHYYSKVATKAGLELTSGQLVSAQDLESIIGFYYREQTKFYADKKPAKMLILSLDFNGALTLRKTEYWPDLYCIEGKDTAKESEEKRLQIIEEENKQKVIQKKAAEKIEKVAAEIQKETDRLAAIEKIIKLMEKFDIQIAELC